MRNAAFDMLRKVKAKAEQTIADDIWPIDAMVAESQSDELPFGDHLMSRHVMTQIEKLPLAQKTIVKGVYFQELSRATRSATWRPTWNSEVTSETRFSQT